MKVVIGSAIAAKVEPPATIRVYLSLDAREAPVGVTEVELAAGSSTGDHSHDSDQVVYILEGEARFTVGDEVHVLRPGDLIHIPAGVVHSHESAGADTVRQLAIFAPPRSQESG